MNDFKIERKFTPPPAKKSAVENLKESAIYFVIIIGIWYVISGIWKILTAPFRVLLSSDQTKLDRAIRIAKEKKFLRDRLLFHSREGEYVPVNGNKMPSVYVLRPVLGVDKDALDSRLMLVPTIYSQDIFLRYFITEDFLDYLQHQVELHLASSVGNQRKFLRTIRRLYPEFTPKFDVIESEIRNMKEKAESIRLEMELVNEMIKAGIGEYVARDIVLKNENDPEQLKKEFAFAKKHKDKYFKYSQIRFFAANDLEADDRIKEAFPYGEDVALALANGRMTYPEFRKLVNQRKIYVRSTL